MTGHLNGEERVDPLEVDKPGYYTPMIEELFHGMEYEYKANDWRPTIFKLFEGESLDMSSIRAKYLQAKDIISLGFLKLIPTLAMYTRGSYTITTYRLLDPTYSRLKISQNGVPVFEGPIKNKSELERTLKINQIDFVGFYK